MRRFCIPIVAFVAFSLLGCNTVGPTALRTGRKSYNQVVQHTEKEQILLNLARLRYGDIPVHLSVNSIATQFSFDYGAGASATVVDQRSFPANNTVGASARIGYAEKPTITFSQLTGESFVKQMLTPMPPEGILLLYYSGWRVDRLFRVCVQRMNGLKNAPGASGPTPKKAPHFKQFLRACELMRDMQINDALSFASTPIEGTDRKAFFLVISKDAASSEEATELRKLLDLGADKTRFQLTSEIENRDPSRIGISTRSMTGILFYLSHGVEVPEEDRTQKRVVVTTYPDGKRFDWQQVLGSLFRVKSQGPAEGGVYASVNYRDRTFFIENADHATKHTFMLLTQMLALKGGDMKALGPTLTLPVGQ